MKQLVISKEDLKHNINQIKNYATQYSGENYTIIGVVKGNGYGLGLKQYSEFLVENGITYLAVATLEEALILTKEKICKNILLLSVLNDKYELEEAVKNDIIVTIDSKENANILNELSEKGYNIKVHIKIDTGFGRYGFLYNNYNEIINTIKSLNEKIEIEGIFSHFSIAYYKNNKHTIEQYKRFKSVLDKIKENNIDIPLKHICNSPAFLNYPEMHLNSARIGSAFLGRVQTENNLELKRIGELTVNVAEIRELPKNFNISYANSYKTKRNTKVAIIPIGYIEGYNVSARPDSFNMLDKIRRLVQSIKNIFRRQCLTVTIKGEKYKVIGSIRNVSCSSRCNRFRH